MISDLNDELGIRAAARNTTLLGSITWTIVIGLLAAFVIRGVWSYLFAIETPPPPVYTQSEIDGMLRVELATLNGNIAATESALDLRAKEMSGRMISRKDDRREFDALNRELLRKRTRRFEVMARLGVEEQ